VTVVLVVIGVVAAIALLYLVFRDTFREASQKIGQVLDEELSERGEP
jgi:hypothetical protein